ncbi:uncharacterized protein ARMOST_18356 [Armillaria ostoyae]|uniref:Uncharacterized protein n=1 Tax=Armillaria ostoyae TaxID=47428 RepID=A0A284S1J9_ARMOS|nr:uncharacterized protein ARMOST_18356 [Armillaria ostoyae]
MASHKDTTLAIDYEIQCATALQACIFDGTEVQTTGTLLKLTMAELALFKDDIIRNPATSLMSKSSSGPCHTQDTSQESVNRRRADSAYRKRRMSSMFSG